MDAARFDRWVRRASITASRRKTVMALALAAFAVGTHATDMMAGPGCKNVGKKCKKRRPMLLRRLQGQEGEEALQGA